VRPPLPAAFFARPAEVVARELLGAIVVSTAAGARTVGRVVETEAYLGREDAASHGYRLRRTSRNAALFGEPGTWYVYLSYGVHWCANLVCQRSGEASAVLLRALEPLEGLGVMRSRRGGVADRLLCAGPGRLCAALGIGPELDGQAMRSSPVTVAAGAPLGDAEVHVGARVGITKAVAEPLRFLERGSRWVSRGPIGS
jgi:DNA-3-methyladenine glycosylase